MQAFSSCIVRLAWLWTAVVHGATTPTACSTYEISLTRNLLSSVAILPGCTSVSKSIPTGMTSSSQLTWPCSATDCTDGVAIFVDTMPDCAVSGSTITEKALLQSKVTACKTTGSDSSGSSTATNTPKTAAPTTSATTAPTTTTTTPTSTTTTTTTTTKPPASTSSSCSVYEASQITDLFEAAATSSNCEGLSMTSANLITIFASCASRCVSSQYQTLVDSVPDCVLRTTTAEYVNKKEQLTDALATCDGATGKTFVYIHLATVDYDSGMKAGAVAPRPAYWLQVAGLAAAFILHGR